MMLNLRIECYFYVFHRGIKEYTRTKVTY